MILILGCGYLGSYLLKELEGKISEPVVATVRDVKKRDTSAFVEYVYCDVSDETSVNKLAELCKNQELTVFYLAASHNIDFVFENPEKAREINIAGLERFLKAFPDIKKMFFASTDCVYGEGKGFAEKFREDSMLNPINEYGRQKLEAEKLVLERGFTVLRFPFMIGPSLDEKPHFYDRICSELIQGRSVELIDGMERSVLSFSQAAGFMYRLSLINELPSVINICGDEALSKYEIGRRIAQSKGISEGNLKKITESEAERFFKEKRASYVSMDNSLLKAILGTEKIRWEEKEC